MVTADVIKINISTLEIFLVLIDVIIARILAEVYRALAAYQTL